MKHKSNRMFSEEYVKKIRMVQNKFSRAGHFIRIHNFFLPSQEIAWTVLLFFIVSIFGCIHSDICLAVYYT